MATSKSQRIAIWVIAAMMAFGSLGFYFLIIIENNNQQNNPQNAETQQQLDEAQAQQAQEAQPLPGYEAKAFDAGAATKLVKSDLKKGDGEVVKEGATISVNYMGWTPDGKIFDSSNRSGEPTPIPIPLQKGAVIEGWVKGIPGMKIGGVRQLVIPATLAYGKDGRPPTIAPNTPLTFIVEAVAIEK